MPAIKISSIGPSTRIVTSTELWCENWETYEQPLGFKVTSWRKITNPVCEKFDIVKYEIRALSPRSRVEIFLTDKGEIWYCINFFYKDKKFMLLKKDFLPQHKIVDFYLCISGELSKLVLIDENKGIFIIDFSRPKSRNRDETDILISDPKYKPDMLSLPKELQFLAAADPILWLKSSDNQWCLYDLITQETTKIPVIKASDDKTISPQDIKKIVCYNNLSWCQPSSKVLVLTVQGAVYQYDNKLQQFVRITNVAGNIVDIFSGGEEAFIRTSDGRINTSVTTYPLKSAIKLDPGSYFALFPTLQLHPADQIQITASNDHLLVMINNLQFFISGDNKIGSLGLSALRSCKRLLGPFYLNARYSEQEISSTACYALPSSWGFFNPFYDEFIINPSNKKFLSLSYVYINLLGRYFPELNFTSDFPPTLIAARIWVLAFIWCSSLLNSLRHRVEHILGVIRPPYILQYAYKKLEECRFNQKQIFSCLQYLCLKKIYYYEGHSPEHQSRWKTYDLIKHLHYLDKPKQDAAAASHEMPKQDATAADKEKPRAEWGPLVRKKYLNSDRFHVTEQVILSLFPYVVLEAPQFLGTGVAGAASAIVPDLPQYEETSPNPPPYLARDRRLDPYLDIDLDLECRSSSPARNSTNGPMESYEEKLRALALHWMPHELAGLEALWQAYMDKVIPLEVYWYHINHHDFSFWKSTLPNQGYAHPFFDVTT